MSIKVVIVVVVKETSIGRTVNIDVYEPQISVNAGTLDVKGYWAFQATFAKMATAKRFVRHGLGFYEDSDTLILEEPGNVAAFMARTDIVPF